MALEIPKEIVMRASQAQRVVVLTGAGVSAESGISTFRGKDGTWNKVNISELATPEAFRRDPARVWQWYDQRRSALKNISPNKAHTALVALEDHFQDFTLVTQNVDGLHRKAGSRNIVELHGNIWNVTDTGTGETYEFMEAPLSEIPPRSPVGNLIRPAVVWFGEMLPQDALETAFSEAQQCDLCLVVGTSAVVQPAASVPLYAKQAGAMVLEFTLEDTELTRVVDHSFPGKAGQTLPAFVKALGIDM